MATENLTLVDKMSAPLKRIAKEAEVAYRQFQALRRAKTYLERPVSGRLATSLGVTRREAQRTTQDFMKLADAAARVRRATTWGISTGILNTNTLGNPIHRGRLVSQMALYRYGRMLEYRHENSNIIGGIISGFGGLQSKIFSLGLAFSTLIGTVSAVKDSIMAFIQPQEKYTGDITRIALTANEGRKPSEIMSKIYDTAIATRADAEASAMLYNRIALSGVKASNDRILRFVESFNKVTALSGTSGQENRAVMLQLAQGMGSNRLGGDEFRSISEQAPLFKYMLAKGMGVNPGDLKQMGAQGKLTAEAILQAFEKVQGQIDEIFKDAPWTIAQLFTIMQAQWQKVITKHMAGYIALRDLIKDIAHWLIYTQEGQEFLAKIATSISTMIQIVVKFTRQYLAPIVLWIIRHMNEIVVITKLLISLWAINKIPIALGFLLGMLKQLQWNLLGVVANTQFMQQALFSSGVVGKSVFSSLTAGATGLGASLLACASQITLIIGLLYLALQAGKKIAQFIQEQKELEAEMDTSLIEANIEKASNQRVDKWITDAGRRWNDYNPAELTEMRFKAHQEIMNEWGNKALEGQRKQREQLGIGEYRLSEEEEAQRQYDEMLKNIQGMADSLKNGNAKIGEVGKINDTVTIDNEGIEMMKTIAERQWVMQNEVVVPQQVTVTIDKSVDMNENSIMNIVSAGVRRAAGGSLVSQGGF